MSFTRLETADLNGKTALVRVDFNVPRNEDGTISDDTRIRAAVPTIQHLQENGAKIVLLSHFGRPKGQPNPDMSLGFIGDIFVMDAFSASHRNHVSSAVIGEYLPAYAGLAMERELDHLAAALDHPKTPVMAIVGGAKVSTKIDLLENKYAAKLCRGDKIIAVAGGGDTVAALALADVLDDFTFISTAGGAFLEWMEGKALPGVEINLPKTAHLLLN